MPDEDTLRWVEHTIGPRAKVVETRALRRGGRPWMLRVADGSATVDVVLKSGDRGLVPEFRTEAAALELAGRHGIRAPKLLAAKFDGTPAILLSCVPGSADVPLMADPARLRAIGAAAASLHHVALTPTSDLPLRKRHMPWVDFATERRTGVSPSTPLLNDADATLRALRTPEGPTVFVHGDLWHGNTMWDGAAITGVIDWEAAGAGHPGVDLGSLRWDAAILYGLDASGEILAGYAEASTRAVEDVAYFDIVAALNTPAEHGPGALTTLHEAGRTDLDGPTLTARRDAFLRDALERLRSSS